MEEETIECEAYIWTRRCIGSHKSVHDGGQGRDCGLRGQALDVKIFSIAVDALGDVEK